MICPNPECAATRETNVEPGPGALLCPRCGALLVPGPNAVPAGSGQQTGMLPPELLDELRRVSRLSRLASIVALAVVVAVVAGALVVRSSLLGSRGSTDLTASDQWQRAFELLRGGRVRDAVQVGTLAYRLSPDYHESNLKMSQVYLAAGHLKMAEMCAEKAYLLLPSEENERYLDAVRKRLARESPPEHPATQPAR